MTSLKGPRTQRVSTNATNVGAPSSGSQPALPEKEGVKGSTAESCAEANTSKASQHTLDRENPSQGLDMTKASLKGTQSTASAKTLGNVGAPSSGSQSAPPEQAGSKDSKSLSKVNTSKAPLHNVDSAGPPPSSDGLDTATVPQKETQSTEPEKILNVGTSSSESPPTPREQVGVENPAAESHSEADTSQVPQAPQHSSGPGTTTEPQKHLQRIELTKTPENVGTPSGDSQLAAPGQVGVENSTAEFHSEMDTTKSQRALDGANPQSSNGIDKTTNFQKELHTVGDERTEMNTADVSTSPAKDLDSSKNQSNIHAQGSHLTSEEVKDGTIPDQPPSRTDRVISLGLKKHSVSDAAHSDHTSGEVMDQNEKSSNPSKSCDDSSTSSIKLQEKTEVNQLLQKEEPRGTKGANKQKASGIAQAEDGKATTPSMEEDINQQMTKYEGDIHGLKAKILSIQTFASQQARERREEIERLEAKISSLEKIVDQQQAKDNENTVESLKTRISAMESWIFRTEHGVNMEHKKEIERLEGKQEKEIQRLEGIVGHLQTKVSSTENVANTEHKNEIEYLKGKHEKEIQRLEAIVERLQTQISSMEHAEHKQEIGRLEGKHEKEIQRLEAVVASMSEQASMLEKEIGRLQLNVSTEEDARQPKKRQAQDPDEKPIASSQALEATKHSNTAANRKINRSAQQPGVKTEPLQIPSPSIKTNIPSPLAVVPKADTLSVAEVGNLVKALNSEIGQTVDLLAESLSYLGLPSGNKAEIDSDELRNYLGPGLCDKLEGKSEPNHLITQLALQTGLANACSSVVNDSPFWCDSAIFQTLYKRMAEKEGQVAANEWRERASNYIDLPQCEDANKKYLTEVLLKLATAVVGGTLESNKSLLFQFNQQLEAIAKLAAKLHKHITEDVTSSELITFTISCDTEFDTSQMEDSENKQGSTPQGKVICTQDMGLLCRKRVGPKKPRGSLKDWGVTTKAKVVLAVTLEG